MPQGQGAVHRMLGVANYFGKYLPNLAARTKLLRGLIQKDTVFDWTDNHAKEWKEVCVMLTSAPLLAIFDSARETKISFDASRNGLGAALIQRHGDSWRPVAYASRVMTGPEQRYSQIEKEAMGITFGCEKFHDFEYDRNLLIKTDHRPLIAIASKGIGDMSPRLQRFFLRLLMYDYALQFLPVNLLLLTDMLSRSSPVKTGDTAGSTEDVEVHALIVVAGLVSEKTLNRLAEATTKDPDLQSVIRYMNGSGDVEGQLKPLVTVLSLVQGTVLKGSRVVIPKSMRPGILKRIHEGHLGLSKCKAKARRLVF